MNRLNLIAIDEENWYMYFHYYSGANYTISRYDMNNRTYWVYWSQDIQWPTVLDVKDGKYFTSIVDWDDVDKTGDCAFCPFYIKKWKSYQKNTISVNFFVVWYWQTLVGVL